jgi:hypothetical protein
MRFPIQIAALHTALRCVTKFPSLCLHDDQYEKVADITRILKDFAFQRVQAGRPRSGTSRLRRIQPISASTLPLSLRLPGRPNRSANR